MSPKSGRRGNCPALKNVRCELKQKDAGKYEYS
jgi:hypothetical protein